MNLKALIKSGILELYVLNLLSETERSDIQSMLIMHPELGQEVEQIESALEKYALAHAVEPQASLKIKIEIALNYAIKEQTMDIDDLVMISQDSDYKNWQRLVNDHFPMAFHQDNFCEVLRHKDGVKQMVIVSSSNIADEIHQDVYESFLILKGQCKCTVGENVFYLGVGGFTEIPLYENHKVEIVTGPVMAIVQYRNGRK